MSTELQIKPSVASNPEFEARLIELGLHGVASVHSRRSYRTGLTAFFGPEDAELLDRLLHVLFEASGVAVILGKLIP